MARKSKQAGAGRAPEQRRDISAGPPATTLGRARWALEVGDVRRARQLASEALAGPEAEREEARALLERIRPDRVPIFVVSGVLLLILFAAWVAILRAH